MIRLDGCSPTPMSSYMVGMGLFRLIAKQMDPNVRAFWKHDRLVLEMGCGRDELLNFLMHEYEPSPVISPWSFRKYFKNICESRHIIELDRMSQYKASIDSTEQILQTFSEFERLSKDVKEVISGFLNSNNLQEKIKLSKDVKEVISDEAKFGLIQLCRNMWPDAAVEWLDAAAVLMPNAISKNPLFGVGGNDGNFDISENFIKRLVLVFEDRKDTSKKWLEAALFRKGAALENLSTFGHNPRGSGRPNSGSTYMGKHVSNPWEHILMVEGMLMFAGGISRRTGRYAGWSVFPFVVDAAKGYATAVNEKDRGEIWLPLWGRPASYDEMRLVLREGRASYGGKRAKTGVDFALAAASLGVERGIDKFCRFGVLGRKGGRADRPYHMSVDLGTIHVRSGLENTPVNDVKQWYESILLFVKGNKTSSKAPRSLQAAVQQFEGRIVDLCRCPDPSTVQSLLVAMGRLERTVSGRTWPKESGVEPFRKTLSPEWVGAANDGTAEFRLAAAAASIGKAEGVGPIRKNLERVVLKEKFWVASTQPGSCVWREGAALTDNLGRVCIRRIIDEKKAATDSTHTTLPLRGPFEVHLDDVEEFLAGKLNEKKITELLLPLSMVHWNGWECRVGPTPENLIPVPVAYALAKSMYDTPGIQVDIAPLRLLEAGRIADAMKLIRRRARASNMAHPGPPASCPPDDVSRRLLGSLVFPVGYGSRRKLLDLAVLQEPP